MLATGGSASAALTVIKKRGAKNIKFLCLIAVKEGIDRIHQDHPDVPIYTGAIDPGLTTRVTLILVLVMLVTAYLVQNKHFT